MPNCFPSVTPWLASKHSEESKHTHSHTHNVKYFWKKILAGVGREQKIKDAQDWCIVTVSYRTTSDKNWDLKHFVTLSEPCCEKVFDDDVWRRLRQRSGRQNQNQEFHTKDVEKNRHGKKQTLNQCKSWHGLLRLQFAKWAGGVVLGAKLSY